ncbi:hypothetical protein PPERSA_08387 [Pseudocohnilembus persalinus]|uniref:Uncharacterized protein n=1 Tax=Pseudocohnilembus persalinus TaxID=266149 RepID=A0A0V0R664_PSEPJ|nr:hypothetical protein PPERSA_08387 [Pseudocohnilembus persalinus]|eukprot:KRX09986.1 hypothetical protein PPERSA_08387 [Pseudocohnilembus persalinus]
MQEQQSQQNQKLFYNNNYDRIKNQNIYQNDESSNQQNYEQKNSDFQENSQNSNNNFGINFDLWNNNIEDLQLEIKKLEKLENDYKWQEKREIKQKEKQQEKYALQDQMERQLIQRINGQLGEFAQYQREIKKQEKQEIIKNNYEDLLEKKIQQKSKHLLEKQFENEERIQNKAQDMLAHQKQLIQKKEDMLKKLSFYTKANQIQ